MSRILITGASGLIGSHLLNMLGDSDHEVFVISRKKMDVPHNTTTIQIDLSENWELDSLPLKMDAIIHLAQSDNFRDFPEKAEEIFSINTLSTIKLCKYALSAGVKNFIYASSGGLYGTSNYIKFKEDSAIVYRPELGFYLGSKYCSEIILDNYKALMNIICLRFFFVYGHGQRRTMLIPRLVDKVRRGEELQVQGEHGIKLSLTHVSDAVKAILKSLKLNESHKINIAGSEILSLKDIILTIAEKLQTEAKIEFKPENNIDSDITADNSLMKNLLVEPSVTFDNGVLSAF